MMALLIIIIVIIIALIIKSQTPDRPYSRPCFHLKLRPSDTIVVIGDIHGSLLPINTILKHLQLRHYVICLGDYHDRGPYSEKVMKTLLSLSDRFVRLYLLIGNHEFDYIKSCNLHPSVTMNQLYHAGIIEINGMTYFLSHAGMPVEKDYNLAIPREPSRLDEHYTYNGKKYTVNNNVSIGDEFMQSDLAKAINRTFHHDFSEKYFALLSILTWRDYTSEELEIPYSNREHSFDTAEYAELFDSMKRFHINVVIRGHQSFTPLYKIISSENISSGIKECHKRIVTHDELTKNKYCVTIHSTDTCGSTKPNYVIITKDGFKIELL